ncbi:hypothetical protein EHS25_003812 [Saitozyma podzolica]|uniref:RNB domain-containing protein n=1 Tax=Saitozyma podzolica TaxID=1890683 RepID=A0A427Y3L6_9TREE|nr:hypothetical protein EHS25_003812 [Saitozyma podzolica]
MSSPLISPPPVDTLAPPSDPSRPTSANSNRSNSHNRRSRSRNSSNNNSATVSRSNSNSSRAPSDGGDRVKKSGATTTISGGTSLGPKDDKSDKADRADKDKSRRGKGKGQGENSNHGNGGGNSNNAAKTDRKPATRRPSSKPATPPVPDPPEQRSIHTTVSAPRTAMEAAADAVKKKYNGDALTSLQKMISDLKGLPAPSAAATTNAPARSVSGNSTTASTGASAKERSTSPAEATSPVNIPSSAGAGSKKLKADAPSFTPSFHSGVSPSSGLSISPSAMPPPVLAPARSASLGSAPRRQSSGYAPTSPGMYPNLPHFPLANVGYTPLSAHQEEDLVAEAYHQQLLQAQQLQYQQIQLLQAQIQANQLAQQQAQQQQHQMGSFIAPRFQALAAQRAAAQQQQQAAQLAQAQQLYELQQQQIIQMQEAQAKAMAEATLQNPPPVFEEDSPEPRPASLGPTGRPQLAPAFTFGKRRESVDESPQVVVNRSEGIGGARATGLAGLAARAHKRTGSELTPAMQQQLEIQSQIEALQARQKALIQEEAQASALGQLNSALKQPRHRRVQSSVPTPIDEIEPSREMPPPPVPSAHSRRHSVNVFAKTAGSGAGFGEEPVPVPSHQRSGSRGMDSGNWRVSNPAVSDLAAAQAQLQSLSQFRAAAGGGHSKMASFSFPNMLPNLLAATTLSTPVGQSLWQQQQAFQMQLQQTTQGPQRKSLFAPYLPQASLPPLLQAGKLVVGILRVNKKNRSDAYVATDVLEADIYICGSKDRNRALEGDIVAVELLDVDEVWNTKKDKEEKKRKKEENAAYDLKPAKKLEKKKDDVEVEGQGLTLFDDEEVNDETKPTYAGHVVAVVERMPGQLFSGQLGVLRPSSAATKEKQELERREREGDKAKKEESGERPKIVWFKPTDKRVPLIAIPTEQAPADFIDHPDAYVDRLFVATIKRWPITSLHPFGTLVEELGPIGDAEVETSALLKDCNFPTEEFSDLTVNIPEREYEIREDLRGDRVFTIDPPTARDLDDALSIKDNLDGTYTVGVHIADVSYFVKSNTSIDRDARKRATSVYLVQRAVPMLPPQLSEQLCSLQPGVDRLTFSAIFTVDKNGKVSCGKLSYADAQGVIGGNTLAQAKVEGLASEVEKDIRALHIRTRRIESGAMTSDNKIRVVFSLDEGKPVDVNAYVRTEANTLVEEFMLLANTSVAQVIANGLPEQSLLRRHEPPIERRLEGFVKRAQRLGFRMDGTSAGTLQKSFQAIDDKDAAMCLELLKRKAMQRESMEMIVADNQSPIRRYVGVPAMTLLTPGRRPRSSHARRGAYQPDQVAKCAQQCNMKKQSAKLAEEQSIHLHLCMLIHDLTDKYGLVIRQARVTSVLDAAFDVVIPEFGIEKRVHVDKMPIDNVVYDEHRDQLSLYWTNQDVLAFLAETNDDPHLASLLTRTARDTAGKASQQAADESALFDDEDERGNAQSKQHVKSRRQGRLAFEGLRRTDAGHQIQDVRELMEIPVIVTADMTKSPPVLVVYACNPYSA